MGFRHASVFIVFWTPLEFPFPLELLPAHGALVMPGSTGGAHGRTGGRLSGAKRARAALGATPRVHVVGGLDKPTAAAARASSASKAASSAAMAADLGAIAESIADQLGLTPRSARVAKIGLAAGYAAGLADGGVAARLALEAAPAAAATTRGPAAPMAVRPAAGGRHPLVTPALGARKSTRFGSAGPSTGPTTRGALVVVQPVTTYGARSGYDWSDVVDVCRRIEGGTLRKAELGARRRRRRTRPRRSRPSWTTSGRPTAPRSRWWSRRWLLPPTHQARQ